MGIGDKVRFWDDVWLGEVPLKERFSRLYRISTQQNNRISEVGNWEEGVWRWEFNWRREMRAGEEDLFNILFDCLSLSSLSLESTDSWRWRYSTNGKFSTKIAYKRYKQIEMQRRVPADREGEDDSIKAFKCMWNNFAPNRMKAIAWKALRGRIPIRVELFKRGLSVSVTDTKCPRCQEDEETVSHV